MNQIFKVIWNSVRGTYIVCDENRMSHGRTKSMKCTGTAVAVAAFLGISAAGGIVNADPLPDKVIDNQVFADTNKTVGKTHPSAAIVTVSVNDASSLTVRGSTFMNNTLTVSEYAYKPASIGIGSRGVDVTVIDSRFTNNVTLDQGGLDTAATGNASAIGVYDADLTVKGSDFTGNKTSSLTQVQGSAIYHSMGTVSISDSSFTDNEAANTTTVAGYNATGGAVSLWGSGGTIANSTFIGNKTTVANDGNVSYGGAIYARSGVWEGEKDLTLTVTDSTFKNNEAAGSAQGLGGAIFVKSDPTTTAIPALLALNVNRGTFEANKAGFSGGAIYSLNAPLSIADTTFMKNEAGDSGGAIKIENGANAVKASTVKGSTFNGNKTTGKWGDGGAIAVSSATLNVDNSVFENNSAELGGAISVLLHKNTSIDRGQVNVSNSTFKANAGVAGGAIYNMEGLSVKSSTFTNNTVAGDPDGGGALFLGAESKTVVANSIFEGNQSNTSTGGAIDTRKAKDANNSGGFLDVTGSTFTANKANTNGGAISNGFYNSQNNAGSVTVAGSTFTGNSAGQKGGAIYNDASNMDKNGKYAAMTVSDSTFTGNTAGDTGGAIYNTENATLSLSGVNTFSGNTQGAGASMVNNDIHNEGVVNVLGGSTTLNGGMTGSGTVNISGGTLATVAIGDGAKINLSGTGVLKTSSDQVMKIGLDDTGTNTDTDGSRTGITTNYKGGTLALTDAKYNLEYVKSVGDTIQNQSQIHMTGTLVDKDTGGALDQVNVGSLPSSGVVLTEVKGNTGGQNLVVGSGSSSGNVNVNGSLGVGSLDMGNADSVQVTGGQSLTLAGNGGELIQSQNASSGQQQDVKLSLDSAATLNLGSAATGKDGQISGNIDAKSGTTINIAGGNQTITGGDSGVGIKTEGTLNVGSGALLNTSVAVENGGKVSVGNNAALTAGSVTLAGNGSGLDIQGTANVGTLTANSGHTINIGNGNNAGSLSVQEARLEGATLFFDPAWQDGVGISGASQGAIGKIGGNGATIDGKLVVGENSIVSLGDTTADWAKNQFGKTGLEWSSGGITAALAIRKGLTLDDTHGAVVVDGSLSGTPSTPDANSVTFADKSLFIVDAAGLKGQAAISSIDGKATVAGSAVLSLANVQGGQTVTILDGFTNGSNIAGWQGDNLLIPDIMVSSVTMENQGGKVTVTTGLSNAEDVLPGIFLANTMNRIWATDGKGIAGDGLGQNDTNSANAGIAFLSRATSSNFLDHNDAVRTINGAGLLAVASGVQASSLQASNAITAALDDHLSLTSTVNQKGAPGLHKEGVDLWVNLLYRNNNSGGVTAGNFNADYKNDFGGIIVGSDYTWKDAGKGSYRVGGALSVGKGEGKSQGDFNGTRNKYDTYGINFYGGWNKQNANVVVDLGYMKGDNEVKQDMAANLGGKLSADIDTDVWTAGIRGEYQFNMDAVDITPHAGLRYLRLRTGSFNTKNSQGTVFHTDSDTQNLWQIPIGVTVSKNYVSTGGWTVKPKLDLSIIPTAGDKNATTRISVPGVGTSDAMVTEVMDSTSWAGTLGLDIQKDKTSFGLRLGYQKSSDANSKGAMLTFSRQFD